MNSGKAYGAAILVAHFAFSCTLLAKFAALISEDKNWRKLIMKNLMRMLAVAGLLAAGMCCQIAFTGPGTPVEPPVAVIL